MERKKLFGLFALLFVGVIAAGTASAFGMHFRASKEERTTLNNAFENNDFNAWKEIMQNRLTQENFDREAEMYKNKNQMEQHSDEVRDAIESGDYDTYVIAMNNIDNDKVLSSEDFNILVQIHQAKQDGDFETIKELEDEIDFMPRDMMRNRFHQGKGIMDKEFGIIG